MTDLPPLPKPWDLQHDDSGKPQVLYTAEQMTIYALTAVLAEREACASLVETQDTYGDCVGCWFETLAAKIRARTK